MANEVQVKLSRSAVIGGQTIGGVDELIAAPNQAVYRQTIPTGSDDYEIDFPITLTGLYVSAIHSSQNITVSCNYVLASTTAHQTLAVAKNVAQIWTTNEPASAKTFTANVTKLFVTNESGFDSVVQVGVAGDYAPGV